MYVFPAKIVPADVVETAKIPTFEIDLLAVITLDARDPVICKVFDDTADGVTVNRHPAASVNSPAREVSVAIGAPPVPKAKYETCDDAAIAPSDPTM